MLYKNYSETSLDHLNNGKKKVLILSKIQDKDIPKIMKRKKLLFDEPDNYLKLPNEMSFNFIIGKKYKINTQNFERPSAKNPINSFIKKRLTRKRTISSLSLESKNLFKSNKKISQIKDESKIEMKKKRDAQISNIFSKLRKKINKSELTKRDRNIILSNEIPSFMKKYIKSTLSQQEKALKCREEYNNIFKKIEHNISQSMEKGSKSVHINRNNIELKNYETANLFKNSIKDYKKKIDKIKQYNKKKKNNLMLETHLRNWEMSLRRPKNFIGLRKGYLNISSDKRPVWIIATEKFGEEEEKIINPNISNLKSQSSLQKNYLRNSNEISNIQKRNTNLKKFNSLLIQGKKLIDLEEKQAENIDGNIKLIKFKYDKDSTKDLLLKMNCSINRYLINKRETFD